MLHHANHVCVRACVHVCVCVCVRLTMLIKVARCHLSEGSPHICPQALGGLIGYLTGAEESIWKIDTFYFFNKVMSQVHAAL